MKCLQPEERSVVLELGEGSYDVTIFLQLIAGQKPTLESTAVHFKVILEYPDETEEVIKEQIIRESDLGTFFQSMKFFLPTYLQYSQNKRKETDYHHDGLNNSSEDSFVRSVWGMFQLPTSSSELKDPFSHLLSIIMSKFVTVAPNPSILLPNSNFKLFENVLENCKFYYDCIVDLFHPILFSVEKFIFISSDFFHFLMKKYSEIIMKSMMAIFDFLGFKFTIQTSSPSEFFYRCVQFHALFFMVSIFYYFTTIFFDKKRVHKITEQTKSK